MNKIEYEKLIEEAKRNLNHSNEEYKEYIRLHKKGDVIGSTMALRNAAQGHGYAAGIYQVLAVIGYSDVSMSELKERI